MGWAIAVVYLIIGEVISRYYSQKIKNKYVIVSRKNIISAEELFIFFLWLPFLFSLAIIAIFEKTKKNRMRIKTQQKLKKAILRESCLAPVGLCDATDYDCSKCQSINQQDALEKIYGEKTNK